MCRCSKVFFLLPNSPASPPHTCLRLPLCMPGEPGIVYDRARSTPSPCTVGTPRIAFKEKGTRIPNSESLKKDRTSMYSVGCGSRIDNDSLSTR